jgi:hypothetical protein
MPEFQSGEQTRIQWNQAMREQVIGQWKGQRSLLGSSAILVQSVIKHVRPRMF